MTRFAHCIVHAGTHKTGTTTVQDVLAAHRAELAAAGIHYPALERQGRDHNVLVHRLAVCTDDELKAARDDLVRDAGRLRLRQGTAATLLLSAEEISTRICNPDPWAGFDDGSYWDQRRRFLARLRSVLPEGASVETFICFRDPESYAHSLYATKLLSGKFDWSFVEFVRRCAPIFDYGRQVEVLAEGLGPVRVESYEHLRSDLANRVFGWLGVPIQVEHTPRLKATPTLDLIHWLARSVQTAEGRADRRCGVLPRLPHQAPGAARCGRQSLALGTGAQDFLRQCQAPPLEDWPPPAAAGPIADPRTSIAVRRRSRRSTAVAATLWRPSQALAVLLARLDGVGPTRASARRSTAPAWHSASCRCCGRTAHRAGSSRRGRRGCVRPRG